MVETDSRPEIRLARTKQEKESIFRFRYQVYVDEMGKQLSYADHEQKMLRDDLDETADLFMVDLGGEVIATARLNQANTTNLGDYWRRVYHLEAWAEFPDSAISMSSRLMVANQWRGSAVLGSLVQELYKHSRELGVRFNFLNCSPSLLEFYEQLGYRRYTDGFMDEDVGYHVPLVSMIDDADYMKLVHSPFWRLARKLPSNNAGTQWFEKRFPAHAAHVNKRLIDHEDFWNILEHDLHADPKKSIALLTNLDEEEARQFLDTGTILPCKAGDLIIRPGDVGDEMFVVLEGVAEVWGGDDEHPMSMGLLGPGQIFGEIAFVSKVPRTAKVVANTDMQLLILTQGFFNRAMKKMPLIVAKVLLNLSVILCDRLRIRTQSWVEAVIAAEEAEAKE